MRVSWRHELAATLGAPKRSIQLIVYVYCLGSPLLIGAALGSRALAIRLATLAWIGGSIPLVLSAAASMAQFSKSARELRLPQHRALVLRHYALIVALLVVVPIILFRVFIPDGPRLVWITLFIPLGLLLTWLESIIRSHTASLARLNTKTLRHPIHSPSDAIRVYFGSGIAPIPLASAEFRLRIVAGILWSAPLVLAQTPAASSLRWLVPFYLGLSAALVWVWMVQGLARFIVTRSAAFAELALLPGLGNPRSQRRALYLAALTRPMGVSMFFSALAIAWAWSRTCAWYSVTQLSCILLFLMLFSGSNIVGQILLRRTTRTQTATQIYLLSIQFYLVCVLMISARTLAGKFPLAFYACLVLFAAFLLIVTARYVRKLAALPHPFLQ